VSRSIRCTGFRVGRRPVASAFSGQDDIKIGAPSSAPVRNSLLNHLRSILEPIGASNFRNDPTISGAVIAVTAMTGNRQIRREDAQPPWRFDTAGKPDFTSGGLDLRAANGERRTTAAVAAWAD
jgi:hypothetical protein